jgi:uncharacterized GH25 family protein
MQQEVMAPGRLHAWARGRAPWLLLVLGALAPTAAAHDMWIVPPAATAAGEAAEVRLQVGHAGGAETVRRDGRRLARFAALGPGGEELPVVGLDGAEPAGVFRPGNAGSWTVVYESHDAFSELPADRFDHYLEEEGLDAIRVLRRRSGHDAEPGRELYSRSLKSLVRVGPEPAADRLAADRAVGLPLELVIETEPALWGAGALQLRLLLRGGPLAGALVDVVDLDDGSRVATPRTDGDGRVELELGPGTWMASVVHMEAETASPRADWRSVFTTLTWRMDPHPPTPSPSPPAHPPGRGGDP